MADRAGCRRSGDGINGAVLETRMGGTGEVLEANLPKTKRHGVLVRNTPSSASAIESRPARAQEGFPGCGTSGEATSGERADLKLCTRHRTAAMAYSHTAKPSEDTQ